MTSDWAFYLTNVNSSLASIYLDLGWKPELPLVNKTWLLYIWVYFQSPREDGLSSSEETPILYPLEDRLVDEVAKACNAVLGGRITTLGRREFYFYGETEVGFQVAVARAMAAYPGYKFGLGTQPDPEWKQYLNVLFPSRDQRELIENERLLAYLKTQGDVLSVPREVRHRIYFPTQQSRHSFEKAASSAGFQVHPYDDDPELPFAIDASRTQSIEQKDIDQTTLQMLALADEFGGRYTGWETPVTTE